MQLQAAAPTDDPELVVVFEIVGAVDKFIGAVKRTPGLEWLLEADEVAVEPDDDFYDLNDREKPLEGRIYLLGSNRQALEEVVRLWNRYEVDQHVRLEHGLGKWKDVFKQLRDVRFWGVRDRIGLDIREYWESRLLLGHEVVRFEIEAWCYTSSEKNSRTTTELTYLVGEMGGRVLGTALLQDIAYHGFLVEISAEVVRGLLNDNSTALVQSERVMLFRPHGQALPPLPEGDDIRLPGVEGSRRAPSGQPIVALFDGMPLQNHPLLAGRISVDDPDGWEPEYSARDRVHGTAMASLILYGELDGHRLPLDKPVYTRPIMCPDPADTRVPRQEMTPDNVLLIDLMHRSVKRVFEGDGGEPAVAPSVKVINLSIGDLLKPFDTELSPWARLLDWLSSKYQVLFIVSAGNVPAQLALPVPRENFSGLSTEERQQFAVSALVAESVDRRLLTPGESINAITVGAVHADGSTFVQVGDRYDLFPSWGISPYSCIGHGFRRAVKPDILMQGGRVLYRVRYVGDPRITELQIINTSAAPGHRVAAPPDSDGQNTKYSRGTSNATALATRGAAQAHSVIEALRAASPEHLPGRLDAVLLKALLVHGAEWGVLENQIVNARPEINDWRQRQSLVTRFIGYGLADIDWAISCTEQRATLVGTGELRDGEALEFRVPLPPSLNTQMVRRRLTITLAWMTPVNPRHAKYRAARLWIKPPDGELSVSRINCDWQRVQRGTVQHEILEGENAIAFAEGDDLVFKVNCAEDGGKILAPVPFALCVTLEVGEGVELPIYQEIQERVSIRVRVAG
ncbi:MAG: S8 family peptidase [Burkholderiales bacterium]